MKSGGLERDERSDILYKKWACPSPRAIFLLVHGIGAFSGRWNSLADFFLQEGIASYAIELKGFGETEGHKGHIDSFDIYFNDIRSLHVVAKREHDGKKIFLIGESMGALISFVFAGSNQGLFSGLICMVPAFKSRLPFSVADKMKMFVSLIVNPTKQFRMPFDARMCTRDLEWQKAMETDEREHRFATPKLLFNILHSARRAHSLTGMIDIPVLFLLAGDSDRLTDSDEAKKIFAELKIEDKEIIQYPDMCHSLSVELGREKIFADIAAWINKRV